MKFGPVVQEEKPFKDISYLELWWPFCSAKRNHLCNFGRWDHEEQFCEIILNLDKWFKRRRHLKISYLELWWPFCSAEHNHLCNIGRGYSEEQFCKIISNLGQWFRRRCCLKYFYLELLLPSCSEPFMQF